MMDLQNSGISVDDGGNLNNVNVKEEDSVPMSSSSRPMEGLRSAGPAPFLTKTYDMVEDSLTNTVVSWSGTNNSFIVWNSHQFSTDLLPQYFKHNNFSSFVRQLHTYGFRKVDPDRWEFANEGFLRGEKHLLDSIQRRKRSCPSQFLDHHHQQRQGIGACVEVGRIGMVGEIEELKRDKSVLMKEVVKLRQQQQSTGNQLQNIGHRLQASEQRQQHLITFLARAIQNPTFLAQLSQKKQATKCIDTGNKKRRLPKGEVEEERRSPSPPKGGIVKNQANTSILSDADQTQNSTILEALLSIMGHADSPDMPTPHETFQDESMSIKSMETTSTFDRDSIHLDRAESEDQDLKAVNDVFWEDLLNEQFDSGTEADADFYPSRSGVSLLVQQMGQTAFHQSIPITSEKCSSA